MELTIQLPEGPERLGVTGAGERNLKLIREALGVGVVSRHGQLRLTGASDAVGHAASVLDELMQSARRDRPLSREKLLDLLASPPPPVPGAGPGGVSRTTKPDLVHGLDVYLAGRRIEARTEGQRAYLSAIADHDLTFCAGPAGTGKTFLAVAAAVSMLRSGHVRKLLLVRPAVEAGEKLGFLPGDMQEKVNPYVRPLLDALHDMMEFEQTRGFLASDIIEVVPLAFMRGRTLNDALIILDEAQNTTRSQMLMFLTRLGHGGKMIVTGDTSQIDLPDPRDSGLVDAVRRLHRVPGIAFCTLGGADIVRHKLVQRIVEAYAPPGERDDRDPPGGDAPASEAP